VLSNTSLPPSHHKECSCVECSCIECSCIECFDVCVELGNNLVLDEVSFCVPRGVLAGVVGPNGGGKTTLFNVLAGLQPIANGSISINGHPPGSAKSKISYVPQRELVNWRFPLSVRDVVSLGNIKAGFIIPKFWNSDNTGVEEALRKVDMWDNRDVLVSNLSGGQRQRTFIARTLTQQAEILLLDEAFSGVDIASQEGVIDVLRDLRDEGKTILMATHDLNSLSDRFDEVLCINRHVCAYGQPESVFTDEVLTELYGPHGEMFAGHQLGQHNHDA